MGNKRRISKLIPGIAVFAMPLLWVNIAYADSITSGVMPLSASLEVASVTISTDGTVDVEVIPSSAGSLGVGKGNVTVTSDSGYTLYISSNGVDGSGYAPLYLNGNISSANKISSLPSTAASSLSANQWGYAVPTVSGSGFSSLDLYNNAYGITTTDEVTINNLKWKGVSNSYGLVRTSTATTAETTPIYFGVRANKDIMAGNYRNTIIYTAFVEGVGRLEILPGEIANSGDRATITTEYKAAGHPVSASDITVTLYDDNISNVVATCINIQIINNGSSAPLSFSCAVTQGSATKGVDYDIEVKVKREDNNYYSYAGDNSWHFKAPTLEDNMYMQDATSTLCTNTPLYGVSNKTYTLIDKRDNKKYLVRKLNDKKCWMVQNLALAGSTTIYGPGVSGHEQDSNLPNGVSYTLPDGVTYSGKFNNDKQEHMYDGTHKDAQMNNTSDNTGAYYNWNVATAGYDTIGSKTVGHARRSICPKSWKLPTSTGDGQFQALYSAYNNDRTNFDAAFNVVYAGSYGDGLLNDVDSEAYWWSLTIYAPTHAYYLNVSRNGSVFPWSYYNRRLGFSVRCVVE